MTNVVAAECLHSTSGISEAQKRLDATRPAIARLPRPPCPIGDLRMEDTQTSG